MSLPGLFKIWSSYRPKADIETFVGDTGDIFYDANNRQLKVSDGSTPGGITLSGLGFSGNYNDLTNLPQKTVTLYQDGELETIVGTIRWYNPFNLQIVKIISRLASTADQTVTVVLKKSGVSFRTIEIPANTDKVVIENLNVQMIEDDYLTVDVTTIGSVSKGSGLSVEFFYTSA